MLEPLFPVLHGAGIVLSPVQQEMLALLHPAVVRGTRA